MLVFAIMVTDFFGRSLRLQFGLWAISFPLTQAYKRVDMYGLESDTAALRVSLPLPLLALCACPSHSLPPSTPFLLHPSLLFPFTSFLSPVVFSLESLSYPYPFYVGARGCNPRKIFYTTNAHRCVLVRKLRSLALKTSALCHSIVPVQLHICESEIIGKSHLYSRIVSPMTKVKRWFTNKPVSSTPTAYTELNRSCGLAWSV
jgi:hypothetical protein